MSQRYRRFIQALAFLAGCHLLVPSCPIAAQEQQGTQLAIGVPDEICPWETFAIAGASCPDLLASAAAIEPPVQVPKKPPESFLKRWDEGAAARGVEPHLSLKTEVTGALFGSKGPLRVDARNLLEVSTSIDLDKMAHWQGARLYGCMHSLAGGNGSDEILMDLQGYSNINAPTGTTLYELWLEQSLGAGKMRFKAGRIDANTEFAYVENAGGFLNSSMGYSPSISALPTHPYPRAGGVLSLKPKQFYYLSEGVFGDSPNGVMSISEGGLRWRWWGQPTRVAYGYWFHTEDYLVEGEQAHHGAQGSYVVAERQFWTKEELPGGVTRGIAGFFQYGSADPWSAEMDRHVGFGIQWTGPWGRRPQDLVGAGASMVHLGPQPDNNGQSPKDYERNFEGFYRVQMNHWLSLTLDGQLINRPGGDPNCVFNDGGIAAIDNHVLRMRHAGCEPFQKWTRTRTG